MSNFFKRERYLQIHPSDNVLVAITDLEAGEQIEFHSHLLTLKQAVLAKHKFTLQHLYKDAGIYMYGVLVGRLNDDLPAGSLLTVNNLRHASSDFVLGERKLSWDIPNVEAFRGLTFDGYHRSNGQVGTANYWLVIPLVFCENRNVATLKESLEDKLGYKLDSKNYTGEVEFLIQQYKAGASASDLLQMDLSADPIKGNNKRIFPNVDGIKFLNHEMGCGGTRIDSDALCGLLAGYITHPNVAGATVLSLGCQHAQSSILRSEIAKRDPEFNKPLYVYEQQMEGTEQDLMHKALRATIAGLAEANNIERSPATLDKLCIGLECGGSDGFSGISANPVLGYISDIIVALGGSVILAEFPELCGVEQELSDRCINEDLAERFMTLMKVYNAKAVADGSGFYMNPSPGNIKDGLITDAIKSAGAARKGGSSPITNVVDYPELANRPGLNLLCTPGNDVESTTAEVAAGANLVLFTTGLGTPTGNPIAPVLKLSTNTQIYQRMPDIIDINCGTIIDGEESIEEAALRILNNIIEVASGRIKTKAEVLGQDDFIPWKRGVSL